MKKKEKRIEPQEESKSTIAIVKAFSNVINCLNCLKYNT